MKKISFYYIIIICCLTFLHKLHAQIDTIVIKDHAAKYTDPRPSRGCLYNANTQKHEMDSLRIGAQIIHKVNQSYYLIIKDNKGNIRHEGQYFDAEPDGFFIDYTENGTKWREGEYAAERMIKTPEWYCEDPGYYIMTKAVGLWTYYDGNGNMMDQQLYPAEH